MISFFVYILKLLINLFVTTILVTDINSDSDDKNENIKFMFFASFFALTLVSISSIISNDNSFYYGATIIVIYFVIHSLSVNFNQNDKIKVYLISLCATLFGFGNFILTLIGFVASIVSYIILYNSTEFYKLFFSNHENIDESSLIDEEDKVK
tara:strand:- start:41 stop:499 length:459 start_codon:yes stop_codon:yes gene_type:complete